MFAINVRQQKSISCTITEFSGKKENQPIQDLLICLQGLAFVNHEPETGIDL